MYRNTLVTGVCGELGKEGALTRGSRNFLMFSAEAEAKQYSVGCSARPLTLFLWCVRVVMALPLRRSHSFTVLSCEPVMTCSSK